MKIAESLQVFTKHLVGVGLDFMSQFAAKLAGADVEIPRLGQVSPYKSKRGATIRLLAFYNEYRSHRELVMQL